MTREKKLSLVAGNIGMLVGNFLMLVMFLALDAPSEYVKYYLCGALGGFIISNVGILLMRTDS